MYEVTITKSDNSIEERYENTTLDAVRKRLLLSLKSQGYFIETPVVGWREMGIDADGVKQMKFVYEHYRLFDENYNVVNAIIRDVSI